MFFDIFLVVEKAPIGLYLKESNFTPSAIKGEGWCEADPADLHRWVRASGFSCFLSDLLPVGDVGTQRECGPRRLPAAQASSAPCLERHCSSAVRATDGVLPGTSGVICPVRDRNAEFPSQT